jgi:hypothetical protein
LQAGLVKACPWQGIKMACRMVALYDFMTWFVLYATSRLFNVDHLVTLWKMSPL